MRERVELGFQVEEMNDAGAFAAKSLPENKFQKMVEQTNDVCHFVMFLKDLYFAWYLRSTVGQNFAKSVK